MRVRKLAARSLAGALGLLLALSLVLVPVEALAAMPQPGHVFYGNVTSDGEPVGEGTTITISVPGVPDYTTQTLDAQGSYSKLIPVDNPDTPEKDGADVGDLIEFYVDGDPAQLYDVEAGGEPLDSYPFEIQGLTELDLMLTVPDTTAPTVGITIADPVNLANVGAVAVTITSDEDGTYIYIISDGVIELTETDAIIADEPVELSLDLSTLADGAIIADASVEDAEGNVGEAPQDSATKDTTPPVVESTTPEADASSVVIGAVVSATFSEDIQEGANFDSIAISPAAGASASIAGDTLTIAHDAFAYETPYEVTIPAGAINDLAGNPLAEDEVWSLTTRTEGPVSFPVTLSDGWNLLSTPIKLDAASDALDQIFDATSLANIESSYRWDAVNGLWEIPAGYELSPLEAVYLKVSSNTTATAEFIPSQGLSVPPSLELQPGLNLIGPAPAFDSEAGVFPDMPLDQALADIAEAGGGHAGYTKVVSPQHNQTDWSYGLGGEVKDLEHFKGYWVVMVNAATLYGFSTTPLP